MRGSSAAGTSFAELRGMHARELHGERDDDNPNDRPTIPVPACRESGIQLTVARVRTVAATVDVVLCDLSRDPRSEDYRPERRPHNAWGPRQTIAPPPPFQNERPPSTSIVRALK
jgi:hypothetical protein